MWVPIGIWSDGDIMWVVDNGNDKKERRHFCNCLIENDLQIENSNLGERTMRRISPFDQVPIVPTHMVSPSDQISIGHRFS